MKRGWHWTGYGFKAMNTRIYSWLYTEAENDSMILQDVQAIFRSMENLLSRFRVDSELSHFNRTEGPFQATPLFFDALRTALWAAEATGGLFDPCVLPALERAGYRDSFETVPAGGPALDLPERGTPGHFRHLELNLARYTITKPPALKLDLGGIGKGWTVDRVADRLLGLGPFLINAGGDLYAYGRPPAESGWEVLLPDPLDDTRLLATLRVSDRAVATSSITRRRWRRGDRLLHHLIDPRTAHPAETDLLSVTVVGQRVALAEVFAKVALIIGAAEGQAYLESIPAVEGLLVTDDGRVLQTTGLDYYRV